MSTLSELYNAIEVLKKRGISTETLEKEIEDAEYKIIQDEILPLINKDIAPLFADVRHELVLMVDYKPDTGTTLHLVRDNYDDVLKSAQEILPDPQSSHTSSNSPSKHKAHSFESELKVIFPDGCEINENKAVDTFEKTIRRIGVGRVRKVVEDNDLRFCKVLVISNTLDSKYGKSQRNLGDGWLLMTLSNNSMKAEFLKKVSQVLELNLEIVLNKTDKINLSDNKKGNIKPKKEKVSKIAKSKRYKRDRFKFSMVGIMPGEYVTFIPTGGRFKVDSDDSVELNGVTYKLSQAVRTFLPQEQQNTSGAYQGSKYFSYNGETLEKLREKTDKKQE